MKSSTVPVVAACAALVLSAWGCGGHSSAPPPKPNTGPGPQPAPTLPPAELARLVRQGDESLIRFGSEAELRSYAELIERKLREQQRNREHRSAGQPGAAPPAEAAEASAADGDAVAGGESITNNQEAGVDEGGIVKALGEYLIVLRRGRLFSIRVGDRSMTPVSMADAYPPGSQLGTWYDEMLVHDRTIVVIGFSYVHGTGATELGLFHVDDGGAITHRATYFLRSNDYYSSRNYASRLVGDQLVFYMPYFLFTQRWSNDGLELETSLPAFGEYVRNGRGDDWNEVIQATDIYRPVQPTLYPVLHTVVTCDLGAPRFTCHARGVLGPFGRTFYVSRDAVYVWVTDGGYGEPARQEVAQSPSALYRLPLVGGDPGVLRVAGAPTDQFSFQQDGEGFLNVLVRAEGSGDWMWAPEAREGDVSLMRVPVSAFSTQVGTVQPSAYTSLPRPTAGYVFNNRFVGDSVLYGTGSSWWGAEEQRDQSVYVYPTAGGAEAKRVALSHGVDRIEVMGRSGVVVGTDGRNLHFSEITLGGAPALAGHFVQEGASQGELRSHGFFFKPTGEDQGVLGLPVRTAGSPGYSHLFQGSANILFLGVDDHELTRLGALDARDDGRVSDQCRMSCVDWYGNARPIFYRGRVFALLGYELVEGRIDGSGIHELGRTNYIRSLLR